MLVATFFSLFLGFHLQTAHAQGDASAKPTAASPAAATPPLTIRSDEQEEQSLLQRHHPFYFAYGQPLSKLQLSFKTPIIKDQPLYFGYTQVMFWALRESSKPFRDLTYNPELFYRLQTHDTGLL